MVLGPSAGLPPRVALSQPPSRSPPKLAGPSAVVTRQFAHRPAIGSRTEGLNQGLDPVVTRRRFGEAELVILSADGQEAQARLLADQPQADPRIGPAAPDRL